MNTEEKDHFKNNANGRLGGKKKMLAREERGMESLRIQKRRGGEGKEGNRRKLLMR